MPLSGIICGLTWLLLAIVSDPLCGPALAGLNVTPIEQLAPAARLAPHALVAANGPAATTLPIFKPRWRY